jgi:hypothetical protein
MTNTVLPSPGKTYRSSMKSWPLRAASGVSRWCDMPNPPSFPGAGRSRASPGHPALADALTRTRKRKLKIKYSTPGLP